MKHALAGLLAIGIIATSTPAQANTSAGTVSLPVELKDPYQAYSLGLIPFGGTVAASYVGTHRFSWKTPDHLQSAANSSLLVDAAILFGGAFFSAANPSNAPAISFLTLGALVGSHMLWFAPYWGDRAVDFNRSELKRNGFNVRAAGQ